MQEPPKYIFPDFFAKWMSKVDQRTQFEASMMSMTLIMAGMVVSVIYFTIYMKFALWFKIVFIINGLAGIVFMTSYLITQYQQYSSFIQAAELQVLWADAKSTQSIDEVKQDIQTEVTANTETDIRRLPIDNDKK